MPLIPALESLEFEDSQGYVERLCLQKSPKKHHHYHHKMIKLLAYTFMNSIEYLLYKDRNKLHLKLVILKKGTKFTGNTQ